MILDFLERVADNRLHFSAAVSVLLVSQFVISLCAERLKAFDAGPPPDLRFGYTPQELNAWYDALGTAGCQAYKAMYRADLFPYMQAYTVVLGAMMVQACRQVGITPQLALVFPLTMYFDVFETSIPAYGCEIYPGQRLSDRAIWVAVGANQFKWMSAGVGMVMLTALWLYSLFLPAKAPADDAAAAGDASANGQGAPEPDKAPPPSKKKSKKTKKN
jgi:hypothetical protein